MVLEYAVFEGLEHSGVGCTLSGPVSLSLSLPVGATAGPAPGTGKVRSRRLRHRCTCGPATRGERVADHAAGHRASHA